jgi:hypothetical protein
LGVLKFLVVAQKDLGSTDWLNNGLRAIQGHQAESMALLFEN